MNPTLRRYTWCQKKPLIQRRLDYWLVAEELLDGVETVKIMPGILSDHNAVYINLRSLPLETKSSSFWRCNVNC